MRDSLLETWRALTPPLIRTELAGRRAPGLPATRTVFLAIDGAARRHLLVQATESQRPLESHDTRGLQVVTETVRIESNPENRFIDIVCLDPSQERLFATLAEDLLDCLAKSALPENDAVAQTISRWRAFWTVKSGTFTAEQATGLFGELWFLHRWIGATGHSRWMVTAGARHDFQWSESSVEVKTAHAASVATATHPIVSLDQLDKPVSGQLYLFSLLVLEDALSSNTLDGLVVTISRELEDAPASLAAFRDKLATYGYVPSDSPHSQKCLRVVREALYSVKDDFPRLTHHTFPDGVPAGVGDIKYSLSLSACEPWHIASRPTEPAAAFLRVGPGP
ncbi:MAG: PD-(D/E)XK motif protein [Pirellulales bacterium]|nr:PD-(D/E)XK motif protein [Pirellulales bacterium]